MIQYIKNNLSKLPLLGLYKMFRKRYNEPNSISFLKFAAFNILPVNLLGKLYRPEQYMPCDKYSSTIRGNIFMGKCTRIQRPGCYIQGRGKVFIGDYVEIASNVAVISGNHNLCNQDIAVKKETIIGDHSWLATNVCVMAGVVLGPRTIVGAGSVVTKSFPDGYCVIAGNPAKVIKYLNKEDVVKPHDEHEFYGYLTKDKFRVYFNKFYKDLHFDYDVSQVSDNEFFQNK